MKKTKFNFGWRYCDNSGSGGPFGGTSEMKEVDLPHDASIAEARTPDCPNGSAAAFYRNGDYLYEKNFQVSAQDEGKSYVVEFEGIYMNSQVFVNGNYVGKCNYGYTDFYLDITEYLQYGSDNLIQVYIKSGMCQTSRWYVGSGIYRDVSLYIGPKNHLEPTSIKVSTVSVDTERAVLRICGNAAVPEADGGVSVNIRIMDSKGNAVANSNVTVDEKGVYAADIAVVSPHLWSVDTPELYKLKAELLVNGEISDADETTFGIRTLEVVPGKGFLLNGEEVLFRGGCVHHDNGLLGCAEYDDAAYRRVKIMKEAGFNAIRSAHNPISSSILRACDKLGMLVMDESFDTWHTTKSQYDYVSYFDENWKFDLKMLVKKDFNHPSVVMYAIGNEIQELDTKQGQDQNRQMAEYLKALDPTRPVTNAVNGMFTAMKHMDEILAEIMRGKDSGVDTGDMEINNMMTILDTHMNDIMRHHYIGDMLKEIAKPLDISGYNYMHGRYGKDAEDYPDRIIVGSETRPNSAANNWNLVKKLPNVIGDFVWTGWDYIGETGVGKVEYAPNVSHGLYGDYPWYIAYCGDIDICGNRRPQSYYREIVWGLRKEPCIAVQTPVHYGEKPVMSNWSWSDSAENWTWPGYEGKPVKVEVYADADEVELFVNDVSAGKKPAGAEVEFTAIFDITYTAGEIKAVAYKSGNAVSEYSIRTAEKVAKLQVVCDRSEEKADGQSLVYLDVSTVDTDGLLNMSDPKKVAVKVDGDAVLLGFGSADPHTEENFYDSVRTTFNGRLQAILRAPKTAGETAVTFTADRIEPVVQKIIFI